MDLARRRCELCRATQHIDGFFKTSGLFQRGGANEWIADCLLGSCNLPRIRFPQPSIAINFHEPALVDLQTA